MKNQSFSPFGPASKNTMMFLLSGVLGLLIDIIPRGTFLQDFLKILRRQMIKLIFALHDLIEIFCL